MVKMKSKDFDFKNLTRIQFASKKLKAGFKKTENRDWEASSFASELCFQTTHVCVSVLNSNGKNEYIGPMEGIDKGLDDEIADVLFNIMNLANFLEISVLDCCMFIDASEYMHLPKLDSLEALTMNLTIQAGNLWDTLFRQDGFKHKVLKDTENYVYIKRALAGVLVALLIVAKKVDVDIEKAFREMFDDASTFLNDYAEKHEIK